MSENHFSFAEKVVLLTGATGGIGRELAKLLAAEGAKLVLTGRDHGELERMAAGLPGPHPAAAMDFDLTRPGDAEALAAAAEAVHGRMDVLVNNAGMGYFALAEESTDERIRRLFELNTFTPFTLARALVPGMRARGGGRVVTIASAAGRVPIPTVSVYGASKSALAMIMNTMRLELEPAGVTVINIFPGTTRTAFEVNAPREKGRDGLDPRGAGGLPPEKIAPRIVEAMRGAPGEVWLERDGRWMSAAAVLWPSLVERRLRPLRDRAVSHDPDFKPPDRRRWRLWQVETSFACSLRCVMCPWIGFREALDGDGLMPGEVWAALAPHLPEVASVDFSGGGEPLQHPELFARVADARAAGCRTGFLTNGMRLGEEAARAVLDNGVDWVAVSLDGAGAEAYEAIRAGASFEAVTGNVRRLASLRVYGRPRIALNMVMMPDNVGQLEAMVRLAADLGADQVNFKQCDVVRGDHGRDRGLFAAGENAAVRRHEKLLARARRLARKLGVETTAFSFTPEELPVCDQDPRDSLFIRHDGRVAPCINQAYAGEICFLGEKAEMPEVHYGCLPADDLLDLWHGALCRAYRETFAERVAAHDRELVSGHFSSLDQLQRTYEEARKAMPAPPRGCNRCHYLYDI